MSIIRRFANLFHRSKLDEEIEAELRSHIEMRTADNIAAGMSPEAARRDAVLRFGSRPAMKERVVAADAQMFLDSLWRDLCYAARQLRRSPGFAMTAILTLALGIGGNTAIFSLFDTVMLRSLPVHDPEHLVLFTWHAGGPWDRGLYTSYGDCFNRVATKRAIGCSFPLAFVNAIRAETKIFSGVAEFSGPARLGMTGDGVAREISGEVVSGDYFSTLGVEAALGRTLDPSDDTPSAAPAVVLSYAFWQSAFGGKRSVLGRTIFLNTVPFTIVGVATARFTNLSPGKTQDLWLPISVAQRTATALPYRETGAYMPDESDWEHWWLVVLARLQPDVSRQQAGAAASVFFENGLRASGREQAGMTNPGIVLDPAPEGLSGMRDLYSRELYISLFAAGMILLIACANVAGLLVARGEARQKEIALRMAVGARRGRIVGQLLTESLLLAGSGGLLGAVIAWWGVRIITPMIAGSAQGRFPYVVVPDWRVLGFTLGITILSTVFFGLAPAFAGTRLDLVPSLKENAPTRLGGPPRFRWLSLGRGLVVAQVALGAVVLCGAGLLVRTLQNLSAINPGFDPHSVLLVDLDASQSGYDLPRIENLYARLRERLAALPGVTSASYSSMPLVSDHQTETTVHIEGQPRDPGRNVEVLGVGADFLRTTRILLLEGRAFDSEDFQLAPEERRAFEAAMQAVKNAALSKPPNSAELKKALDEMRSELDKIQIPVLVNEAFVRQYLHRGTPLATRMMVDIADFGLARIVGVVADTKLSGLRSPFFPTLYYPFDGDRASFELRTMRDPIWLAPTVRQIVKRADPTLPIGTVVTQTQQINEILWQERMLARLSTFFAVLALLLASIGLYGLLAYEVTRRRREIGIRVALGALPGDVMRAIVRQGLLLAAIGAVAGTAASVAVTRALGSLLYGVHPADPLTFAAVAALFLLIALAACWIPARRALRVDPMVALRYE
ncbi:MAG: FtsX-like permease family protein [Candidatus Acidiferrales bacterium]